MHLYERRASFPWRGLVITVVVFAALIILFSGMLSTTRETADREQVVLLQNAIHNAAVSAYATEGAYPATLSQITAEYGVVIDEERFVIDYDIFASNVMPTVTVHVREK